MAVLTTLQKAQLTKMNRAAQKVALGSLLSDLQSGSSTNATAITSLSASAVTAAADIVRLSASATTLSGSVTFLNTLIKATGSYVAVSADSSASRILITTGISAQRGQIVQAWTSGSNLSGSSLKVVTSGCNMSIYTWNGSSVLIGDLVEYMAW